MATASDYDVSTYYHYPVEIWDENKCAQAARRVARDGLGTKYPFPGYIGSSCDPYGYGVRRFNGGCERDGEWYAGQVRPLPMVADGYEIISVPSWGWRIRRIGAK